MKMIHDLNPSTTNCRQVPKANLNIHSILKLNPAPVDANGLQEKTKFVKYNFNHPETILTEHENVTETEIETEIETGIAVVVMNENEIETETETELETETATETKTGTEQNCLPTSLQTKMIQLSSRTMQIQLQPMKKTSNTTQFKFPTSHNLNSNP